MGWQNWKALLVPERSHCSLWVISFAPCSDCQPPIPQAQSKYVWVAPPCYPPEPSGPNYIIKAEAVTTFSLYWILGKNALRSALNYFTSSPQPCWKSHQITKLIGSTLLPYVVCRRHTEVYLGIRTKEEWNITALCEDFILASITEASLALILLCVACPSHHPCISARRHQPAPMQVAFFLNKVSQAILQPYSMTEPKLLCELRSHSFLVEQCSLL